jgi:hypothetical protein
MIAKASEYGAKVIGLDTTTNNSAVAEYLELNSDLKVIWISFGGAATDRPVSPSDSRLCNEVYYNFSAELALTVTANLRQIRGIDPETAMEMCSRFWEPIGEKPTRQKLETKQEYKARMKKSCDRDDCVSVGYETFRQLGSHSPEKAKRKNKDWNKVAKRKNAVWEGEYADTSA